jgi:hypothetical protein
VNRLTKQIGLVLISSSLILHGCERSLTEEEKKKEEEQAAATSGGAGTSGTRGYHSGPSHFYYGRSPYPSGTAGSRTGTSSFSGTSTSRGGSRSGTSVSTRGGFGAAAHGVSS